MIKKTEFDSSIFTLDVLASTDFCEDLIDRAYEFGFEKALVQTVSGEILREDIRNNSRVFIDDESLAEKLWMAIKDHVPDRGSLFPVGLNERFRVYRYKVGQSFQWHYDSPYERASGERSALTLMIFLNEGFEGGHTRFSSLEVIPKTGRALIFPHELRHCGAEVENGIKYVLRTDIMYSSPEMPHFL